MKNNDYSVTIGIECHVQLKTLTKLFSGAANDAREAPPNTLVNHIDFGLPGALPVFNKEALHLASKAALALNSRPQLFSKFDRKHYFYPDLPMGYQITQYEEPIILGGSVTIEVKGKHKVIGITRAHLEADAGKSTHPIVANYSLVDLNRAGTPLLEIVSEPDMNSAQEARAFAKELYRIMRYADVTYGDLYHGNMRFDVNVSISKNNELGTRTETKNLNSFRSVEKAVEYEVKRQTEVLNNGGTIVQETRGWDEAKQKTVSQRSKENADDYRYMPDPDIPPIVIDEYYIDTIISEMPLLPTDWRSKLHQLDIPNDQIELLIDANIESSAGYLDLIINYAISNEKKVQTLVNWLINIDIPITHENEQNNIDRLVLYTSIEKMLSEGMLSSTNAKLLINKLLIEGLPEDINDYALSQNLIQQSNKNELELIIDNVLSENPAAVLDINNGQQKVVGFLVGKVMQVTKGQANPAIVNKILYQKLNLVYPDKDVNK